MRVGSHFFRCFSVFFFLHFFFLFFFSLNCPLLLLIKSWNNIGCFLKKKWKGEDVCNYYTSFKMLNLPIMLQMPEQTFSSFLPSIHPFMNASRVFMLEVKNISEKNVLIHKPVDNIQCSKSNVSEHSHGDLTQRTCERARVEF